jgi:multidrug resistance efflux pump
VEAGAPPLPRLRPDLVWSHRTVRGEEVWFLKDPVRRTYFRFSDAVAFVLRALSPDKDRAGLRTEFEVRFGQPLDADDLESILEQAANASLLETDESEQEVAEAGEPGAPGPEPDGPVNDGVTPTAARVTTPRGAGGPDASASRSTDRPSIGPAGATGPASARSASTNAAPAGSILGRLLSWNLGVFDPDALLVRLERHLWFAFTPAAAALWVGAVALALAVVASNLAEVAAESSRLLRWQTLVILYPVLLLVTILHEFGHGLACKHFGGEVREMGFLFLYFQPAFYCDISDTWMMDRRARLWSVAAGTWVQVGLWALAVFIWRVTVVESFVHAAALVVVAASGVGALMNLIPFIKLDGYYFLSDGLEVPNLRARSFAHVRRALLGAVGASEHAEVEGAGSEDVSVPLPAQNSREARIFWMYGVSAAALSGVLLVYLLAHAHLFVARDFGVGCVAALWLAVVALAAPPVGKFAKPVGRAWSQVLRQPRLSRSSIALVTSAVLLAALFLLHWELRVSAEAHFEPLQRADVRSEIAGIVESVRVAEGQQVNQGDVLFDLSSREYRAGLEQAQAELGKARAQLALLVRGTRVEEIRNAESRLEKTVTREEYARRDHTKAQELYAQKIIPMQELLAAEEELAVRQKEVKEAHGQLDLLRAGSRPEEIERVRAEVARLESVARVAGENLERARLRAPISGRVVTPHLELKRGQKVEPGTALCEIADTRRLRAEVEVPEGEAGEIRPGQKVKIKARAFPDRDFWGEVVSVASAAEASPAEERASFLPAPQSRIRVYTEVDNSEGLLKPEMTGNAKIYCGKKTLINLLTRRLVRYVRTEFWF